MGKLKLIEIVVLAGAALLSAAKYAIKFIDYIFKLTHKDASASTA